MRVIELFKELTSVPRCSGTHQPFLKYIQEFSQQNNYICKVDNANNILCYKEGLKPEYCLQSHYDIVCLVDGKVPQIIEQDGYLMAKDSTLGADNGIGCAYMMALMEEGQNLELLFTCDEEIGLIGANNIEHTLQSSKMINLDSEEEGHICIGCAGGIDIFGTNTKSQYIENSDGKTLYEITIDNLDGGHSGVDIDKNITNALKLIARTIKECDGDLLELNGGERINSIPKRAKAIIASLSEPISLDPKMQIEKVEATTKHYRKLDDSIINFIYTFANGVRGYDSELGSVLTSINLAKVITTVDSVNIELSARSMDNNELDIIKKESCVLLDIFGFEITTDGKYPAWKPEHSEFTTNVLKVYKKHNKNASLEAIHAGLECAIFKEKYPDMQILSIGPNIYFPHSNREKCEISSVDNVYKVLKDIIS